MKEENSPLVSVIIPAFNCEKYVELAVRSIMDQTYRNLEILVCNDCSTDGTYAILQRLASEDDRIVLLTNDTNMKIVKTLNKLVSLAKGKYIARMDADDISLPKRIEKQVEFLESHGEIDLCGTNAWHMSSSGEKKYSSSMPCSSEKVKLFAKYGCPFFHPSVMAKALVLKNNPYSEEFLHAEDYALWCKLIYENGMNGVNLKDRLLLYRENETGISRSNSQEQINKSSSIFDAYRIVEDINFELHKKLFFSEAFEDSSECRQYILGCMTDFSRLGAIAVEPFIKLMRKVYFEGDRKFFLKIALRPSSICFFFVRFLNNRIVDLYRKRA